MSLLVSLSVYYHQGNNNEKKLIKDHKRCFTHSIFIIITFFFSFVKYMLEAMFFVEKGELITL